MIRTFILMLFWCGLVSLLMWLCVGTVPDMVIGFIGAIVIMFIICAIAVTNNPVSLQKNTNKYVIDYIKKRNDSINNKHLKKIDERNRTK